MKIIVIMTMKIGVEPREKFRIRTYNNDESLINLELKRKYRGKTQKEVEQISKEVAQGFINNNIQYDKSFGKLLNKLYIENKTKLLKPVIIVEYDRTPYICNDGNVRITLDRNISSSRDINKFFDENIHKRPIMPEKYHLLEVKYDEFLPAYIYKTLQLNNLRQITFSKYYLCRKFSL